MDRDHVAMFSVQRPKTIPTDQLKDLSALAVTWDDFTQHTTFHGIRYIFGNGLILRRAIWVLCVIAAVTVFTVQVVWRTRTYYNFNTNVDVEVMYERKIPFPAVTICNQNTFRLTAAAQYGDYDLLHSLYARPDFAAEDLLAMFPAQAQSDMSELVQRLAHTREDLLVSCTWRNRPCNLTAAFQTVHTDFGICFMFNGDEAGSLVSDKSGSNNGLRLLLNVERYEYMIGPQSEIGLQVLLHDQAEAPLVESLGFAVAPGTHTLVGVTRKQEEFREPPYGNCSINAPTISSCLNTLKMDSRLTNCGCEEAFAFYHYDNDTVRCNTTAQFFCVDGQDNDDHGSCRVPCKRTTYDYSLSYALLASNNIQNVIYPDPRTAQRELAKLTEKVLSAGIAQHRYESSVVSKDAADINALLTTIQALSRLTETSLLYLGQHGLADAFEVADVIVLGNQVLEEDLKTIVHGRFEQYVFSNGIYSYTYHLFRRMEIDFPPIVTSLENCLPQMTSQNLTMNETQVLCESELGRDIKYVAERYINSRNNYNQFEQVRRELDQFATAVWWFVNDTGFNYTAYPAHKRCEDQLEQLRGILDLGGSIILNIIDLVDDNETIFLNSVEKLLTQLPTIDINQTLSSVDLNERHCEWMVPLLVYRNTEQMEAFEAAKVQYEYAQQHQSGATHAFNLVSESAEKVSNIFQNDIVPVAAHLETYLSGRISIEQLLERLDLPMMGKLILDYGDAVSELSRLVTNYHRQIHQIPLRLQTAYTDFWSLKWPLMTYTTFFNTEIWTKLVQASNNSAIVEEREKFESKTVWPINLDLIITTLYEPFVTTPTSIASDMNRLYRDWLGYFTTLLNTLEKFEQQTEVNNAFFVENFIEMDIFYKELKHERVTQRPSFELLSLLSEVGGFLGLLLGASVLTVCEILDYFVISTFARCKDKQHGKTAWTDNHP